LGINTQFNNDVTVSGIFTLNSGSFSLGISICTVGSFIATGSATRSFDCGLYPLRITGFNSTIVDIGTNVTPTGFFGLTYSGSTGTRTISSSSNLPSFTFTGNATDTVSFVSSGTSNGGINFTNFSGTWVNNTYSMSIATSASVLTLSPTMTCASGSNTVTLNIIGSADTLLTSNGTTINFPIVVSNNTSFGLISLGSAFTSTSSFSLTGTGTSAGFNTRGFNLTCSNFSWSGTNFTTISGSTITLTGTGTVWNCTSTTGPLNITAATIVLSDNSTTSRTFIGGGRTYNIISIGGATSTSTTTFTGANTMSLQSTKTVAHTIVFPASTTTTFNAFQVTGTAGNVVTIQSSSAGTAATWVSNGTQTNINYLSIRDINGTTATNWYVGADSTNVSNNTNLTFSTNTNGLFWVGGTGTWDTTTTNWSLTSGGAGGAGYPSATCDATYDGNSGASPTITFTGAIFCKNLTVSGVSGTLTTTSTGTLTIYGNTSITSTTTWSGSGLLTLGSLGTNTTLTSTGVFSFSCAITVTQLPGYTTTLNNAVTFTGAFTWLSGNINLSNLTITAGTFVVTGVLIRVITFGTTGAITTTGSGTAVNILGGVLTISGTPTINVSNAGASPTTITLTGFTESNAINVNVTTGTYTLSQTSNSIFKNLNYTGFNGTVSNTARTIYGNLTIPASGGTYNAGANVTTLAATSGTQTITTNNRILDFPITQSGAGGTVTLSGALTLGTTRTYTLTSGTLNLTNNTLSVGLFDSNNTSTRVIQFGTGNITTAGAGTVFNVNGTNLTYTGAPTVNISNTSAAAATITARLGFTEANAFNFNVTTGNYLFTFTDANFAKSLNFTGYTGSWTAGTANCTFYGSVTLASSMLFNAGTGTWTFANTSGTATLVSAAKTINAVTISAPNATVAFSGNTDMSTKALTMTTGTLQLPAGFTTTVGSFVTTGTTLKYLTSSTSGTRATISDASGTNTVTYLSVKDSNAIGGAVFDATDPTNVNAGNNIGWLGFDILAAITEAFGLADSSALTAAFVSAASEAINNADTPTAEAAFVNAILENLTASDSPAVLKTLNAFISEPQTFLDSSTGVASFVGALTENLNIDDLKVVTAAFISAIIETLTALETNNAIASLLSSISENINVNDAEVLIATFTSAITESTTLTDNVSVITAFVSSLFETLSIAELETIKQMCNSNITESLSFADTQAALIVFVKSIIESIALADTALGPASYANTATENINLLDAPIGFAWVKIDNTEGTQWVLIDNRQ
jgi:hypothetical protein